MHSILQSAIIFLSAFASVFSAIDPCEEAKAGVAKATEFITDSVCIHALDAIKAAAALDSNEHTVVFGRNSLQQVISSSITYGHTTFANIKLVDNSFADLHNHANNFLPDAGDLYGLIDINARHPAHDTRYVVTKSGILYALLITNTDAAGRFNRKYPRRSPAAECFQPSFPEQIVDDFREMKYNFRCSDEMALAFVLEKYNTGVSLLKLRDDAAFRKIRTLLTIKDTKLFITEDDCR